MALLNALLVWLGMAAIIAIFQAVGNALLDPLVGAVVSHCLVTVLICLCVIVMITGFVRWTGRVSLGGLLVLGAFWALLSLGFELGAGHYAMGKDWPTLMAGYNIVEGRLWPLVPLTMLLWPMAAGRLHMR